MINIDLAALSNLAALAPQPGDSPAVAKAKLIALIVLGILWAGLVVVMVVHQVRRWPRGCWPRR